MLQASVGLTNFQRGAASREETDPAPSSFQIRKGAGEMVDPPALFISLRYRGTARSAQTLYGCFGLQPFVTNRHAATRPLRPIPWRQCSTTFVPDASSLSSFSRTLASLVSESGT